MNKQELITIIRTEVLLAKSSPERKGYIAGLEEAINIIEGFSNEPQKPIVPQFVADWYEENKDDFETNLFCCVHKILRKRNNDLSEFEDWVIDENTEPFKTLVNMHQFDYEVEKEKRYVIKFKNIQEHHSFLNFSVKTEKWLFSIPEGDTLYRTHHTRKELEEAGFGWVFDCEGVEVQEVE